MENLSLFSVGSILLFFSGYLILLSNIKKSRDRDLISVTVCHQNLILSLPLVTTEINRFKNVQNSNKKIEKNLFFDNSRNVKSDLGLNRLE